MSKSIHSEDYVKDDIIFVIKIYKDKSIYFSEWYCKSCNMSGGPSGICDSFDKSIIQSRINIDAHINREHTGK